jgi:hypothetical protein
MKKSLSILAALALLLAGCVDPTMPGNDDVRLPDDTGSWGVEDEWDLDEIEDDPEEDDPVDPVKIIKKAFTFVSDDTKLVGESVAAETTLGSITLPETGDTWTTSLIAGYGDTDNDKFKLVEVPGPNPSVMPAGISYSIGGGGGTVKLVVKQDVMLEWGHYSARVGINNGSDTYIKVFEFDVTLSPPLFKEAPRVYPIVNGGKDNYTTYLDIRWDKRATAQYYTVYVGESDVFSAASPLGTYDSSSDSATMTAFPGETGPLPDDTAYWVWITATNDSGTTPPSPAAKKRTTAPVPEFFWEANNEDTLPVFDMGSDHYRFTETTTEVGMGMTIKYWFGVEHYIGDIYYHEKFYPTGTDNKPFPNTGKGNENCIGYPAGVFVIKYQEGHVSGWLNNNDKTPGKQKRYSAVYYWGMDTPETIRGYEHQSYIVNQWAGYAETVTLEEALDKFTCARIGSYLAMGPEPYGQFFHKKNLGTHGGEPEFPYQ